MWKPHVVTNDSGNIANMCAADIHNLCNKDATSAILIFDDSDDNRTFDDNINRLVKRIPLDLKHGRIHLRAGRRHYIKFYGNTGLPRGHFGHIKYCPTDGNHKFMYKVSLNKRGIHKIKPDALERTDCPLTND